MAMYILGETAIPIVWGTCSARGIPISLSATRQSPADVLYSCLMPEATRLPLQVTPSPSEENPVILVYPAEGELYVWGDSGFGGQFKAEIPTRWDLWTLRGNAVASVSTGRTHTTLLTSGCTVTHNGRLTCFFNS